MSAPLMVLLIASCSVPTAESPRPGSCDPFQLTATMPAADSLGVPSDVAPALTFNDFPNPDTIGVATIALYTGFYYHTGRFWVDLLERQAFFQPSGNLMPGLGYTLVVRPGVRSLRGCKLATPDPGTEGKDADLYTLRFQIAEAGSGGAPRPVPPSATYDQVVDVFAAHCAGAGCHLAANTLATDPLACLDGPGGNLSLCGRDAFTNLVSVPSRQVSRLIRVVPRDSSRSYLLRKLIGAPPVVGHSGVPADEASPSNGDDGGAGGPLHPPLSRDELGVIQNWIDNGAPPS